MSPICLGTKWQNQSLYPRTPTSRSSVKTIPKVNVRKHLIELCSLNYHYHCPSFHAYNFHPCNLKVSQGFEHPLREWSMKKLEWLLFQRTCLTETFFRNGGFMIWSDQERHEKKLAQRSLSPWDVH